MFSCAYAFAQMLMCSDADVPIASQGELDITWDCHFLKYFFFSPMALSDWVLEVSALSVL